MIWLAFIALAALIAAHNTASANSMSPPPPNPPPSRYGVESWRPYLEPLLARTWIPIEFALGWIRVESGGNPCAIGSIGANGPDGQPREQGITQLYNPDDFTQLGIPKGSFRAYCVPGTQVCSRWLTKQEMGAQAEAHVKKIQSSIAYAQRILVANKADTMAGWRTGGRDFWRLVKLVHGLPGLVKGFTTVAKELGRAPASWDEFKNSILVGVKLDPGTEHYRSKYAALFKNAESVTQKMQGASQPNA